MNKEDNKAVLVDWGTSSFRLWLLKQNDEIEIGARSGEGMSTLNSPDQFEIVLEKHLSALGVVPDLPVMICGMAGARQGWAEAAYVHVPASLDQIAENCISVSQAKRDVRILPGVAQTHADAPDVMRGEETQLMGAAKIGGISSTICMPGTHSKWVKLEDNRITAFSSFMTGEIFALLSKQSTLAHSINDVAMDLAEFDKAVMLAIEKPECTSHELFSVRAAPLLGLASDAEAKGKLSGLLLGLELAGAKEYLNDDVTLIGTGRLADLYKRVFGLLGSNIREIDAEEAVCGGLRYAAKHIWN